MIREEALASAFTLYVLILPEYKIESTTSKKKYSTTLYRSVLRPWNLPGIDPTSKKPHRDVLTTPVDYWCRDESFNIFKVPDPM
jgi:hypothetical protein